MWNSAVFIAAFAILAVLFVLFPLRVQMLALAIAAGLIALPQMLYLSTGSGRASMPKLLHWGYHALIIRRLGTLRSILASLLALSGC